jgi:hypothetical protein
MVGAQFAPWLGHETEKGMSFMQGSWRERERKERGEGTEIM